MSSGGAARAGAEQKAEWLLGDANTLASATQLLAEGAESAAVANLPDELGRALSQFADDGTLDSVADPDPVWVVVAKALAMHVVSGKPSAQRVAESLERLECAPWWVPDVWRDEIVSQLLTCAPDLRADWHAALGQQPEIHEENCQPIGPVVILRSSAEWAVADALQLWSEQPPRLPETPVWEPLDILYRAEKRRWFNAINEWSDPRLVQGVLVWVGHRDSPAEILRFLRDASAAFGSKGEPLQAGAAVVLCQAACQKVRNLLASDGGPKEDEVRVFLREFASVLLHRPDGRALATAFASHLARCSTSTPTGGTQEDTWVLEALLSSLTAARITTEEHRRLYEARRSRKSGGRRELSRSELHAFFVAARTADRSSLGEVESLLEWALELLRGGAEVSRSINYLIAELSSLLRQVEDPVERWRRMFKELEPQRERSEFAATYMEADLSLPSLVLIAVLAGLIASGCSKDEERDAQYGRDRAMRIYLTDATRLDQEVRAAEFVAVVLAVGCERLGLDGAEAAGLVRPISHDREVLGYLLQRLSGVFEADALPELLRRIGRDPADVVDTATRWAEATSLPRDQAVADATTAALTDATHTPAPPPASPTTQSET